MPPPKFLHKSKKACLLILQCAVFIQENGKLISDQHIKDGIKLGRYKEGEDIEFSYRWYLNKVKEFKDEGIELPPFTQLCLYEAGDPSQFNPTGLFRGVNNNQEASKPVLLESLVPLYVELDPALKEMKGDAKRLAKEINKKYYGPSAEQLRVILLAAAGKDFVDAKKELERLQLQPDEGEDGFTRIQKEAMFRTNADIQNRALSGLENSTALKGKALEEIAKLGGALTKSNEEIFENNRTLRKCVDATLKIVDDCSGDANAYKSLITSTSQVNSTVLDDSKPAALPSSSETEEETKNPAAKSVAFSVPSEESNDSELSELAKQLPEPVTDAPIPKAPSHPLTPPRVARAPARPPSSRKKTRPTVLTYEKN